MENFSAFGDFFWLWVGRVERLGEKTFAEDVLVRRLKERESHLGRRRCRRQDNIQHRTVNVVNIHVAPHRVHWWALVKVVMNEDDFLLYVTPCSLTDHPSLGTCCLHLLLSSVNEGIAILENLYAHFAIYKVPHPRIQWSRFDTCHRQYLACHDNGPSGFINGVEFMTR